MSPNNLFIISGPSGVGKTTIGNLLKNENFKNLRFNVSCTTRSPRPGEIDGVDYHFISREDFKKKIDTFEFLEYSEHFGNYYGTLKENTVRELRENSLLMILDVNGAESVRSTILNPITIFLEASSKDVLIDRLQKRSEKEEVIQERIARVDYEMKLKSNYDYVIVNDDLDSTISKVNSILQDYGIKK